MKVFCSKCNNYWRGSPFIKACVIPRGREPSWFKPSEARVLRNNPSVKNANNDCKDFRKGSFWHKIASFCAIYFGDR